MQRDPFELIAVGAALKRTGVMPIISTAFPAERDVVHANSEYQRNGQDCQRYCVDVAVKLGADRMISSFCAAHGRLWMAGAVQKQQEFERAVNNLRPVAAYAHDHGVRLALEVINRYESSFINPAMMACALWKRSGTPPLVCCWIPFTCTSTRNWSRRLLRAWVHSSTTSTPSKTTAASWAPCRWIEPASAMPCIALTTRAGSSSWALRQSGLAGSRHQSVATHGAGHEPARA